MEKILNIRQEQFIKEYLADKTRNASKAAVRAGYAEKHASQTAARLMKDPQIKARIKEELDIVLDASGVTPQRVMDELARMAFFRPEDFVRVNPETGKLEVGVTPENLHKLVGVTGVKLINGEVRFEANKEKALEMLVRILEIEAGDDVEDPVIIEYHLYPDDEFSNRTAASNATH